MVKREREKIWHLACLSLFLPLHLQVVAVVPGRSEWEVCIALHDHDFDPEKAITALLDSDPSQVHVELKQ